MIACLKFYGCEILYGVVNSFAGRDGMLSIGALKRKLADVPDDARCHGYEGEDVGITIFWPDGRYAFIRAGEDKTSDDEYPTEGPR